MSARAHDVAVADNLVRRSHDDEMGTQSLVPIESLHAHVRAWELVSGQWIATFIGYLTDADFGPKYCSTASASP